MVARWMSVVLGSVLLALAGCGGGGGGGGGGSGGGTATAPTITTPPQSTTAQVGQSASFSVVAAGTAPLAYQWLRNGVPIAGATLAGYTTGTLAAGDDGAVFSVTVTNSAGSSTSAPATLTVTTPPPAGTTPRLAGWSRSTVAGTTTAFLNVIDPGSATQPAQVVGSPQTELTIVAPRATEAGQSDTVVTGMAPFAYFTAQGRAYQVDLRAAGNTTPVRISSLTDACYVGLGVPLVADATQALVAVSTAGPDGSCTAPADNALALVRTGMPETTPALTLPAGVSLLPTGAVLVDLATRSLSGLLVIDSRTAPSQLMVYSPALQPIGPVAGGSGVVQARLLNGDATAAQAQYLVADGTLRRLTWTGTQATLSASLHSFASGTGFAFAATDSGGTYFMDGQTLMHVQGEAAATPVAPLGAGTVDGLYLTSGHVLVHQYTTSLYTGSITAVPRAGGAGSVIVDAAAAGSARVVGTRGDRLYYLVERSANALQELRERVVASGAEVVVDTGLVLAAPVWNRTAHAGALWDPISRVTVRALDAAIYCKPAAPSPNCATASVHRFDAATSTLHDIGLIDHALRINSSFMLTADNFGLYGGLPGSLQALVAGTGTPPSGVETTGLWVDLYLVPADPLASVRRVTQAGP